MLPGQSYTVPQIAMALATAVAEVRVVPTPTEVAEDQIKAQEKQRVLGVVPNFYVSYDHNAVPLTSKQKFELAWKTTVDPVSFGVTGGITGIQQAQTISVDMDKAREVMESATAPPTPTLLQARTPEGPYCHRS